MKQILILEKTKDELVNLGYQKCTEEKYNQYKKDTTNYATAISDDGKYYYKKKTSSSGGGTTYPPTGLDQTKGDAFRAWMKKNYPEFKCDDGSSLAETGQPDNTCIRKAWKQYSEVYNKPVTSTDVKSTDVTTPKSDTTSQPSTQKTLNINCDERWTENNYFETYFDENAEVKAKEFVKWINSNSKRFYFNPGGLLFGLCGSRDIEPYVTGDLIHQSPLVKYLATKKDSFRKKEGDIVYMPSFDFWRNNVDTISKPEVSTTDTKTSTQTVSETIPAELNNLFGKGTAMYTQINKPGAIMPERRACKQLIDLYEDAYFKFGGEKTPQGMTRNEFVNQMNNTKKSIYYCMKEHPGLKDKKFDKFLNMSDRDWAINLFNLKANTIQENNMSTIQKSLRKKLVETKIIKSLKVELHRKKLDHIAENFYKENYRKFFTQIFEHTKMLQNSNGLLTEDVTDSFQKAFNSLFLGNESKMKEQTISHILRELKVEPNSQMGIEITDELNGVPDSEVPKLLSDPTFVADKITSAIDKTVTPQDFDDDSLESMLKSNAINKMRSTMDDIKFKIANKLTGVLDTTRQNVEKTSNEIKQSFIDRISSKLTGF